MLLLRELCRVLEALDTDIKFTYVVDDRDNFHTTAYIGGRVIAFDAHQHMPGAWLVSFHEKKTGKHGEPKREYGATGSGNELAVFSMVKRSMEELIKKKNPDVINFTASKVDGDTRTNLYDRLVRKFASDKFDIEKRTVQGVPSVGLTRKGAKKSKRDNHDQYTLTRK